MADNDLCTQSLCLRSDSCERFISKDIRGCFYHVPEFNHDGKPFDGCEFYREQTTVPPSRKQNKTT